MTLGATSPFLIGVLADSDFFDQRFFLLAVVGSVGILLSVRTGIGLFPQSRILRCRRSSLPIDIGALPAGMEIGIGADRGTDHCGRSAGLPGGSLPSQLAEVRYL